MISKFLHFKFICISNLLLF